MYMHVCINVNFILLPVVSKLSQSGEEELLTMKQKVQILADETAHSLKKNVYKNYSQFIETAKEISSMIKMKTWYMYGEIAKESI